MVVVVVCGGGGDGGTVKFSIDGRLKLARTRTLDSSLEHGEYQQARYDSLIHDDDPL